MNTIEVRGDTVSKLSKLVKQAGDQQRVIVTALTRQIAEHNQLVEKCSRKEEDMLKRADQIEEYLATRQKYQFHRIEQHLIEEKQKVNSQKYKQLMKERSKKVRGYLDQTKPASFLEDQDEEQNQYFEENVHDSNEVEEGKKTDNKQTFDGKLSQVKNVEAEKYIKKARVQSEELQMWLRNTDWELKKKTEAFEGSIKIYSQHQQQGKDLMLRFETKFDNISVSELLNYYMTPEKRMAWEGVPHLYDKIEEWRSYPMETSVYYYRLMDAWPNGAKDLILLTQIIRDHNERVYLSGGSVIHPQHKNNLSRFMQIKVYSFYFEPTTDGTGVKQTFILSVNTKTDPSISFDSSISQTFIKNHCQSVVNLKRLLGKRLI